MSVKEHFESLWGLIGGGAGTLREAVIGQEIDGRICRFFLPGADTDLEELANRVESFTYMNDKNGQHHGELILVLDASMQDKFKAHDAGFDELCDLAASYDAGRVQTGLWVRFMGSGAPSYDNALGTSFVKYLESCGLHVH